ncbi:MAG: HEAT repeat domain-containing protein, partial [Kiritimatiellia bacterium]
CEETRKLLLSVAQDHQQDEGLRAAAALGLGEAGAVAELCELLDAKNSEVLVAAIAALDAVGGFDPDRLRLLLDHPNRWVRLAAVKALAALGTDDAVSPVLELIQQSDTDSELRIAGVIGLGQGRAPAAVSSLENIARDKQSGRRLRQYAIHSLGLLAERVGQPALQHIVEDCNTDTETRALALLYLDLGSADKTVSYLSYWLTHGAIHEQCCAAQRMAEIGTREAVYQLMAGFDVFSNITRSQHVIPLTENRSAVVTDALTDVLRSTRRAGVMVNCTIALAGRYAPHAVDALIKACGHSSPAVRAAAAQALGETGDPKAVDVLIRLITEEPEPRVVRQALRALRMRDFASNPKAEQALRAIAGTERDTGVPGGADIVEQEDHSWVLRHWAAHYEDETIPNLTYESSLTYDPVHRRVLQWGSHGRRYDSPQTGFTWEYLPDAGDGPAWHRPFSRQEVPGTCMTIGATAFDANRASLLVTKSAAGGHGWVFNLRKYLTLSIPWCYDARQKQWYPMRPLAPLGGTLGYYDRANDVAVFFANGRPQIYDLHSNTWTSLDSVQGPRVAVTPYAYDSRRNRMILLAGEDDKRRVRTWAFDLQSQVFVELRCSNPPPPLHGPMVYDSHNDVMLVFNQTKDHMQVYAYHCAENRWERLPRIHPCPVYRNSAAAYDQFRNLVVLCGGEDSPTGSPQVRETWTYRYRASALQFEPQPAVTELKVIGNADGSVRLSWVYVGEQPAKGFDVYRGTGPHPWLAEFRKLNDKTIKQCTYEDRAGQPAAECIYYRVSAVDEVGHELASSYVGRTQPPVIREVWCSTDPTGRIRLEWLPSDREDVIGYNVYAAEVAPFDAWTEPFSIPGRDAFKKLNAAPLRETSYLAKVFVRPTSELGERQWPRMQAFYVTAVGSAGLESGPSPVALSMAGEPGPVLCVQMPDGRSLIVSGRSRSAPLAGYHLLRMDCYHNAFVFRTTGAPLASSVLVDSTSEPRRDRRVYFVAPVDCVGQIGIPSSEAWAINPP